jgi:hypothetical protein
MKELANSQKMAIDLPENLESTYRRMAERAEDFGNFIEATKQGYVFHDSGDVIGEKIKGVINSSVDYYGRWSEDISQLHKRSVNDFEGRNEAHAEGYHQRTLITFTTDTGEIFKLDCAEMSSMSFDQYVRRLLTRGTTPNHVVTEFGYLIVQTKRGGPRPKVIFRAIGMVDKQPVDVTPIENPRPTKKKLTERMTSSGHPPETEEVPKEWI